MIGELRSESVPCALVGGLAVSVRGEVRFTRDVDLALGLAGDAETEALVYRLRARGFEVIALVEQDEVSRLATVRLLSPEGVVVDLLAASCGIEAEVVRRASAVDFPGVGSIPVARAEELLAMKTLSFSDRRPLDRIDAVRLIQLNPDLDLAAVRANLRLISDRGYNRRLDLMSRLDELLTAAAEG